MKDDFVVFEVQSNNGGTGTRSDPSLDVTILLSSNRH
jgi:hypothetical protein